MEISYIRKLFSIYRIGIILVCFSSFGNLPAEIIGQSFNPKTAGSSNNYSLCVWQSGLENNIRVIQASSVISGSWSNPVTISDVSNDSISPSLVLDADGNAIVIWCATDLKTGDTNIMCATLANSENATWSPPFYLSQSSSQDFTETPNNDFKIIFNSDRTVIVTWSAQITGYTASVTRGISGIWSGSQVNWNSPTTISINNS